MEEEDEEVARLKSQVKEENFRPIFPFLLLPFCDSLFSGNSFQVEEAICKLGDENGRRKVYIHCYLLLLLFVILVLMLLVVKCKVYFIDISADAILHAGGWGWSSGKGK